MFLFYLVQGTPYFHFSIERALIVSFRPTRDFTRNSKSYTFQWRKRLVARLPPLGFRVRVTVTPYNSSGLPDWAISRELGYPKVLIATDLYDGRFANFWPTRNFDERILCEQILSFSVSLFLFSQRF